MGFCVGFVWGFVLGFGVFVWVLFGFVLGFVLWGLFCVGFCVGFELSVVLADNASFLTGGVRNLRPYPITSLFFSRGFPLPNRTRYRLFLFSTSGGSNSSSC